MNRQTAAPYNEAQVDGVVNLTQEAADQPESEELKQEWLSEILNTGALELVAATSRLSSDEQYRPAIVKALREAIISEVERKNTVLMVSTLHKLDVAATRLTWVSLVVAVVGIILAGVQVWQGFTR